MLTGSSRGIVEKRRDFFRLNLQSSRVGLASTMSVRCRLSPLRWGSTHQALLCALWDRPGDDLTPWGCLLDLGSFREVMLSDVHRSAWVRV